MGHELLRKKENAIEEHGESHYWNHWDVMYDSDASWIIKCKHCTTRLKTKNISSSVAKHMGSTLKCDGSTKAWKRHKKMDDTLTPGQQEVSQSIVQSTRTKRTYQSTIDVVSHKSTIEKFINKLKRWALLNSTSVAFRALEDSAMKEALQVLGYNQGISRKTLATSFLDELYEEFVNKRRQSIIYFGHFQISADSWKYKNANNGKKLVGATLNIPAGLSHLGDIFVTTDDNKVSGNYIYDNLLGLIESLGAKKYIGSIFDGEQAYQNAGKRLQQKYAWSIHLTCYAHTLNLILKDISSTESFKETFSNAHKVCALCNVRECRVELNEQQEIFYGKTFPIRPGVETRFGFMVREAEDLLRSKDAILALTNNRALRQKFSGKKTSTSDQRDAFAAIDQDQFWITLETIEEYLLPIAEIIHFLEQDKSLLGQIFFIHRFLHHKFRLDAFPLHKLAMDVPSYETPKRLLYDFEADMAEQAAKRLSPYQSGARRSDNASLGIPVLAFLLDLRFYTIFISSDLQFMPPIGSDIAGISSDDINLAKEALASITPDDHREEVQKEFENLMLNGLDNIPKHISDKITELKSQVGIPEKSEWKIKTHCNADVDNYPVAVVWKEISTLCECKCRALARFVAPNLFSLHVYHPVVLKDFGLECGTCIGL